MASFSEIALLLALFMVDNLGGLAINTALLGVAALMVVKKN
jgi:hypothetical protein